MMMKNGTIRGDSVKPVMDLPVLAMVISAGLWALIAAIVLLLVGCDTDRPGQEEEPASQTSPFSEEAALNTGQDNESAASRADTATQNSDAGRMVVEMRPTEGHKASGRIVLKEEAVGELHMEIILSELSPGKHGFHVHETGDCSAPDAASAGGHFDPENLPHGSPADEKQHAGDLGNLEADQLGEVRASLTSGQLSLDGPNSVRGRAFIVHRDPDDLESQPSGAAGVPVACGVVATE